MWSITISTISTTVPPVDLREPPSDPLTGTRIGPTKHLSESTALKAFEVEVYALDTNGIPKLR